MSFRLDTDISRPAGLHQFLLNPTKPTPVRTQTIPPPLADIRAPPRQPLMAFAAEPMDLEVSPDSSPAAAAAAVCSICLDAVACGDGVAARSTARLQCGHEFHLGQPPRPRPRSPSRRVGGWMDGSM